MERAWILAAVLAAVAACHGREHGDAPPGTFAPGGPIDNQGNAATSRALSQPGIPPRAPAAGLPSRQAEAGWELPADLGPLQRIQGRITAVEEGTIRIRSPEGRQLSLEVAETTRVTHGGVLVAPAALREGAEVRAAYGVGEAGARAAQIDVLQTPQAGPGLRGLGGGARASGGTGR